MKPDDPRMVITLLPLADLHERITSIDPVFFQYSSDKRARSDHAPSSNHSPVEYHRIDTNPHIILDDDATSARLESLFDDLLVFGAIFMVNRRYCTVSGDQHILADLDTVACIDYGSCHNAAAFAND